jgi:acyl carrier protein
MSKLMTKVTGLFQAKKPSLPLPVSLEEIQAHVVGHLAASLSIPADSIDPRKEFSELGFDSLQSVRFAAELEDWLKVKLPPTLLWECPNVTDLAKQLAIEMKLGTELSPTSVPAPVG